MAWKRVGIDDEIAAAAPVMETHGGGRIVVEPVAVSGLEDHVLVLATKTGRERGHTGPGAC